jgi:hypothetical protein
MRTWLVAEDIDSAIRTCAVFALAEPIGRSTSAPGGAILAGEAIFALKLIDIIITT